MRLTVLSTDLLVYFPGVWAMAYELTKGGRGGGR
jgi:hypothetical protein